MEGIYVRILDVTRDGGRGLIISKPVKDVSQFRPGLIKKPKAIINLLAIIVQVIEGDNKADGCESLLAVYDLIPCIIIKFRRKIILLDDFYPLNQEWHIGREY